MKQGDALLIHLGGLGDVCLSESLFLSLSTLFRGGVSALGYTRFLSLFAGYFCRVLSVEERRWLFLFSDQATGQTWQQIILVGKDRSGDFRARLAPLSCDPLLFVDMYPDEESIHVEEYQLRQLSAAGITPLKKEVTPKQMDRVILYPEISRGKRKWPYEHFLTLAGVLISRGVPVTILEAPDVPSPVSDSLRFDRLEDMSSFLSDGGIFVSNDSGVAHLAAALGLTTITLFHDQRPDIWHPRGKNLSIACDPYAPGVEEVLRQTLHTLGSSTRRCAAD